MRLPVVLKNGVHPPVTRSAVLTDMICRFGGYGTHHICSFHGYDLPFGRIWCIRTRSAVLADMIWCVHTRSAVWADMVYTHQICCFGGYDLHQQDRMVLDSLGVVGGTGGAGLAWASAENGAENVENCIWIDKIAIPLIACGMSNMFATKRGPENTGTYVARGRCVVTGGMGAKEPGNPVWRVLCEMRVGGGLSSPLNRGYPAIRAPTQRSTFDNNTRLCSTSDAMKNRPSFPNACPHCQMAPSCVNLPYQAKFGSARGHHAEERWRDKIAAMSGATMSKLNAASTNTDRMPALESDNNATRTIGMQRSGCATWG
ncbi:hypothetical protein BD779DRAFT_1476501 [Infundibulicybe gibba]|nr:hypothetical protein BD779DRAFT_1476501 [Infundibulicybe gibba]